MNLQASVADLQASANPFEDFKARIIAVLERMGVEGRGGEPSFSKISVHLPRDRAHGDLATNAAMMFANKLGQNAKDFAARLAAELETDSDIRTAVVAGPGFVNLTLDVGYWQKQLELIAGIGEDFGRSQIGAGRKVNVEYVSANPTGPMHVGHCRGAVLGDALANLLAYTGVTVTKEYYINDAGAQIDVLANSVMLRYREALGEDVGPVPAGLYPGDYLVPVGKALVGEFGPKLTTMSRNEALSIVKEKAIDAMMDMIREDLAALDVRHDVFFSERTLHGEGEGKIAAAITDLTLKGHIYKGTLPPPKNKALPEDWEDREQTLFKSTAVGDDIDRALVKSDGTYTYFAADVAYMKDKVDRGFDETIFVLGADHGGYVKRLEAVGKALAGDSLKVNVLLCQLVTLLRDGQPVTMSKRAGEFVTLRDAVEEVGRDAIRFMMLYRKNTEPLDFDFAKVTEQSKDNPVFYVQYASARCHSVMRQAADVSGVDIADVMPGESARLVDEGEVSIIRKVAEFPRIVELAAQSEEPHRIAFYLYDLASELHSHWNRGTRDGSLRFVQADDVALTRARLLLVKAVANTLKAGLSIIGADAPERMTRDDL